MSVVPPPQPASVSSRTRRPEYDAVRGLLGAAGGCIVYFVEAVPVAYFAGLAPDAYDAAQPMP